MMGIAKKLTVGQRLRREREHLNWSQEQLAEKVGTTALSINRWEHDKTVPRPYYRAELCRVFNKSADELFGLDAVGESEAPALPTIWNVPHMRNLYFTGRENVLAYLYDALLAKKTVALTQPHVISGLGGIGKTQTALEYTYRYGYKYQAVLWVRADFYKSLVSDFLVCAHLLNLPEKHEADTNRVVEAVMSWLCGHTHWLLVLDNADDLEMVSDFLPTRGGGHTLLTTRAQATGPHIRGVELEQMGREEGTLLLLRRAKLLTEDVPLESAPEQMRSEAEAICELVDGLPLALDQAAAYVEEHRCSFAEYLHLYQSRRADLLQRRGVFGKRDYPKSVATTWSLSFEQVEQISPAAADLLRLCAYLHPDAIAEEMLLAGSAQLSLDVQSIMHDPLLLNDTIAILRKYSLVRRNPEMKVLTMHRLVQTVLKDAMSKEAQKEWAERVVRLIHHVFPMNPETIETWPICERYLPHVQTCASHIEQWNIVLPEAAQLLHRAGNYLHLRGQYTEQTEHLYQRALTIREQVFGEKHVEVGVTLNDLGLLYIYQGKREQARQFYYRALAIYEQVLGEDHPEVASTLNNLAMTYLHQSDYAQAEVLLQRVVAISEAAMTPDPAYFASYLNNLASVYLALEKYEQAESLLYRALTMREQVYSSDHPDVANSLAALAKFYRTQRKYEEAEQLFQRALAIYEQSLGPMHPDLSLVCYHWALLCYDQGKYEQAEALFQRTLVIHEHGGIHQHLGVVDALEAYAKLLHTVGREAEAVALEQKGQVIQAKLS